MIDRDNPNGDGSSNSCGASSQPKRKTFLLAKKQFDSTSLRTMQHVIWLLFIYM